MRQDRNPVLHMQRSQPSNTLSAPRNAPTTRRRILLFLLSMSPVIALVSLFAWGLIRTEGNPGSLLEHNDSGEIQISARPAPDFGGTDLTTALPVNNASLLGNVVMVDFWSSWCVACRVEAADLAEVYHEYADKPVEFVGLAIWDDTGDVLRHIDQYDVTYPNALDETGQTAVLFGVTGVPEKFFLGPDGTILRKINGPVSKEHLREIIDELLES